MVIAICDYIFNAQWHLIILPEQKMFEDQKTVHFAQKKTK